MAQEATRPPLGLQSQLETGTRLETGLRIDHRTVLTARLLEQNVNEIENMIETELSENPALERVHVAEEAMSDREIVRHLSTHEPKPHGDDRELWRSLPYGDSTPDPLDFAASHSTLDQHLRAQLATMLPGSLCDVIEFVLGSLNENGYLIESPEELALASGYPVSALKQVIMALHHCEPAGVGASGVQECLFIQLRSDTSLEGRLARLIVRHHLEDFRSRTTTRISRKYRVLPDVVRSAFQRILTCTPFPIEGVARTSGHAPRSVPVPPDLVLRRNEHGWQIEPQGADPATFFISSYYTNTLSRLDLAPEERRHLRHYVSRAGDFISGLEKRRLTMMRIGHYLIEHQQDFLLTGDFEFLEPLTRSRVATDLGVHESTISRATRGKFVQINTGETVPFDVFFKAALRVQKMIEGILALENPNQPLSDERISSLLAMKGVFVARRTVNKYRDRTHLLSSRSRRSA